MEFTVGLLIVVLAILVILSGFMSATETAFSSINLIRVKQMMKKGDKKSVKAKYVFDIATQFTETLSAILIVNNISNIVASSITTVAMGALFGARGVVYGTIGVTIIILIFSEILPKSYAKNNAESFAMMIVGPLRVMLLMTKPLTFVLGKLQETVERLFSKGEQVTATKDELMEIVQLIEHEDVLDQTEREIIQSAIDFDDIKVRTVMKQREDVVFAYEGSRNEKIKQLFLTHRFSRIPIVSRETEQVVGILHQRDFFGSIVQGLVPSTKKLMKQPIYVSQRHTLAKAMEIMQRSKSHQAVVLSSLKSDQWVGIVTLEDILEELVGEIYDESDALPEHVVEIGHHIYEVDGSVGFRDFLNEYAEKTRKPKTKTSSFSGWIKELKGEKLKVGDQFAYDNLKIKVLKLSSENQVEQLQISVLTKEEK